MLHLGSTDKQLDWISYTKLQLYLQVFEFSLRHAVVFLCVRCRAQAHITEELTIGAPLQS